MRRLAALIDGLDLRDVILVGHSTGGGEVVRYAARHGGDRVAKIVTAGAVPPVMVKSESNPEGSPIEVFDEIRAGVLGRPFAVLPGPVRPFFGANRDGSTDLPRAAGSVLAAGDDVGLKGAYDCIKAFSETDFTEDLKALEAPMLIAHGDDDQIVPIAAAALKSAELVKAQPSRSIPAPRTASPGPRAGVQQGPARLHRQLTPVRTWQTIGSPEQPNPRAHSPHRVTTAIGDIGSHHLASSPVGEVAGALPGGVPSQSPQARRWPSLVST